MHVLGVDAGGTATRWRVETATGGLAGEGTLGPASGHVDDPELRAQTFAVLGELVAAVLRIGPINAVVAGVTGLTDGSPASREIAGFLAGRLGIGAAAVQVVDDMRVAYHAAFRPGEGFLVYSGTGSVACHVSEDGALSRVGGHGYLVDDGGSAAWIALRALREILRGLDEAPQETRSTPLASALGEAMGSLEWEDVRAFVYGGDRGRLGTLARAVAAASDAGDAAAVAILRDAGGELARLASILASRHGLKPVALMGGAVGLSPLIRESLLAALPGGTVLRQPARHPVEAAAALARRSP